MAAANSRVFSSIPFGTITVGPGISSMVSRISSLLHNSSILLLSFSSLPTIILTWFSVKKCLPVDRSSRSFLSTSFLCSSRCFNLLLKAGSVSLHPPAGSG